MEQNHNQNNKKEDIDINIPQIPLWTVNYLAEFLTMNKQLEILLETERLV